MTKPDRNCLFCSAQTIEQRNVDKGKPIVHHPTCEEGLQCFSCNSRACTNCLQDILEAHSEKLISRDRWCQQVQSFLLSGTAPKGFIGHCCELKVASTQFRKQQKQQPPLNKTLFDGHLHFPEFGILVDSPFSCKDSCIDVLGLGEAKPLPPTWHCVISHDSAATYHDKNIKPNGKGAIVDDGIVQEVCVPLPYKDNECRKFTVRLRTATQTAKFDEGLAGTNDPSPEEIKRCFVVNVDDRPEGLDVDIITGRFGGCELDESLLLCRFYNKPHGMKGDQLQALHQLVLKELCDKNGFEASRTGGSSGLPVFDKEFFDFVHNGLKWECFYMRVHDQPEDKGRVAKFPYSPPIRGGQFDVSQAVITKYPFLFDFAETKLFAALILQQLNKNRQGKIQQGAVDYELKVLKKAKKLAPGTIWTSKAAQQSPRAIPGKKRARKKRKVSSRMERNIENRYKLRQSVLVQYVAYNRHTLVQHPVGYHKDVFKKGKQCLENKFCFVVPGRHGNSPMGRGGSGPNKFVVALLDWGNSNAGQLRRSFDASGRNGNSNASMTTAALTEWCSRHPAVRDVFDPNELPAIQPT